MDLCLTYTALAVPCLKIPGKLSNLNKVSQSLNGDSGELKV